MVVFCCNISTCLFYWFTKSKYGMLIINYRKLFWNKFKINAMHLQNWYFALPIVCINISFAWIYLAVHSDKTSDNINYVILLCSFYSQIKFAYANSLLRKASQVCINISFAWIYLAVHSDKTSDNVNQTPQNSGVLFLVEKIFINIVDLIIVCNLK